jgi:1-acyl-sn-glycerol-3-phosphate acyltransferase
VIYVIRYTLIALYTVFWASTVTVACLFDRSGESGVWGARRWARWSLATCGIQVEAEGLEEISSSDSFVVMSNHQSVFDIVALVATCPLSWRFVAKRELTRIPFFGWGLVAAGHIVIDRSRTDRAVGSLKRAAARVRAGTSVIIFPEGTRSPTSTMQAFKSGGFHLAMQAGVPILPVSISGSRRITPRGSLRVDSGRILVRYRKPIPTRDWPLDQREGLKEAVREAIFDGFDPALQWD